MMMEHHLNFDQKTFQVFRLIINSLIKLHLNQLYQQIQSKFNRNNNNNSKKYFSYRPISSWNAIVSAQRPRSTSPHSVPPSQDPRSDRSRSFNNKLSSNNKKSNFQTTKKSPTRASKTNSQTDQQRSQSLTNSDSPIIENNIKINDNKDDGFIQTKQQHRRLKRKNKIKEESIPSFTDQSIIIETAPYALDDENAFPTLGGQQISLSTINKKSENDSNSGLIQKSNTKTYQICLTDMFNSLSTSTQIKQENSHQKLNSLDSKREQSKSHKPTKLKRIINKESEENQSSFSKVTVEKQSDEKETDTNTANITEE